MRLFSTILIAGALFLGIALESEAACRRIGRGRLFHRLFHRAPTASTAAGCPTCNR